MSNAQITHPTPGIYQHYKGAQYRVLGSVQHSENEEWLVVYQALYGKFGHWVRPLTLFIETVNIDGKSVARFQLLEADTARSLDALTKTANVT
ncbi:MAG: DUF1653 domain-containing protein [Granulosicoccus sp.]